MSVVGDRTMHFSDEQAMLLDVAREFCRDKLTKNQVPQKVVLVESDMHSERFKKIRR